MGQADKVVIDSSILIDKFRGGNAWERFRAVSSPEVEIYLPSIVYFEVFGGKSSRDANTRRKIIQTLIKFRQIDINPAIARRAGEIYRDITPDLDMPDYIIAATALEIGGEVVTLNHKHFQKIPGIRLFPDVS